MSKLQFTKTEVWDKANFAGFFNFEGETRKREQMTLSWLKHDGGGGILPLSVPVFVFNRISRTQSALGRIVSQKLAAHPVCM